MFGPAPKGSFWDNPSDGKMYRYLLVRLLVGIAVGVVAWYIGHTFLRTLILHH